MRAAFVSTLLVALVTLAAVVGSVATVMGFAVYMSPTPAEVRLAHLRLSALCKGTGPYEGYGCALLIERYR